jgi:hypothetical protein
VFTARYGLIPYIKQIAFRLQKFNAVLVEYLSRQRLRDPEDDAFALEHVGAINIEQCNKLSIECAVVCSL